MVLPKYHAEFAYWKNRFEADAGVFSNGHYRKIMLAMAQQPDESFLDDLVVADFGCGPRGSLAWAKNAKARIGIDVLANRYTEAFGDCMESHAMEYVESTEASIPLDDASVDVLYTLNAIDHVNQFSLMASEMLRILRPGGLFVGSFNLHEPRTSEEPQNLTPEQIERAILNHLEVDSYRVTRKPDSGNLYAAFYEDRLEYTPGEIGVLWVSGSKQG